MGRCWRDAHTIVVVPIKMTIAARGVGVMPVVLPIRSIAVVFALGAIGIPVRCADERETIGSENA